MSSKHITEDISQLGLKNVLQWLISAAGFYNKFMISIGSSNGYLEMRAKKMSPVKMLLIEFSESPESPESPESSTHLESVKSLEIFSKPDFSNIEDLIAKYPTMKGKCFLFLRNTSQSAEFGKMIEIYDPVAIIFIHSMNKDIEDKQTFEISDILDPSKSTKSIKRAKKNKKNRIIKKLQNNIYDNYLTTSNYNLIYESFSDNFDQIEATKISKISWWHRKDLFILPPYTFPKFYSSKDFITSTTSTISIPDNIIDTKEIIDFLDGDIDDKNNYSDSDDSDDSNSSDKISNISELLEDNRMMMNIISQLEKRSPGMLKEHQEQLKELRKIYT